MKQIFFSTTVCIYKKKRIRLLNQRTPFQLQSMGVVASGCDGDCFFLGKGTGTLQKTMRKGNIPEILKQHFKTSTRMLKLPAPGFSGK